MRLGAKSIIHSWEDRRRSFSGTTFDTFTLRRKRFGVEMFGWGGNRRGRDRWQRDPRKAPFVEAKERKDYLRKEYLCGCIPNSTQDHLRLWHSMVETSPSRLRSGLRGQAGLLREEDRERYRNFKLVAMVEVLKGAASSPLWGTLKGGENLWIAAPQFSTANPIIRCNAV
jgi:hypothetical protein